MRNDTENEYHWMSLVNLGVGTYVLGSALLFYGRGTVLLLLVLFGYLNRVIEFGRMERGTPLFDDWGELVYDGARLFIIWLIYFVALPLLTLVLDKRGIHVEDIISEFIPAVGTATVLILNSVARGDLVVSSEGGAIVSAIQVGQYAYELDSTGPIIVFLILAYIYPAALLRFSEEGSAWAAFDRESISQLLSQPSYAGRWVGFALLSSLAVYTLVVAGPMGERVGEVVWRKFGNSFILTNEVEEIVVFGASALSFQLLVFSHFILGYDRRLAGWSGIVEFLDRYDTNIKRVFLGGILLSLGILPTLVFVVGFVSLVLSRSIAGQDELPSFSAWGALGKRGVYGLLLWTGCLSLPWTVLFLGQRPADFPGDPPPDLTAVSNTLIGATGVPIGPPVSFQLDRLAGDLLWAVNVSVQRLPFTIADPRSVRPEVLATFIGTLLLVWFFFPLLLAYVDLRRFGDRNMADIPGTVLVRLALNPVYWRAWGGATVGWLIGGLPLVGWYVWRRHVAARASGAGAESLRLAAEPLGLAIPAPNRLSLVSILFLLSASVVCFYAITRGYQRIGRVVGQRLSGGCGNVLSDFPPD